MSGLSNKFISQSEVDDKRKKRQEEWDQKRKPDDPLECPEEIVDNRSLYEKLEEQKQKKQDDYDEEHKLKNSVKGLDEDEAQFLEFVSKKQMEIEKARSQEEQSIFKELKDSSVSTINQPSSSQDRKPSKSMSAQPNKKSQTALLAGAVKKRGKHCKKSYTKPDSVGDSEESKKRKASEETDTGQCAENTDQAAVQKLLNQRAKIIGILPGLGAYDNNTSDSETSSSDSECDFKLVHKKIKIQLEQQ